jgi:hypothetical protein
MPRDGVTSGCPHHARRQQNDCNAYRLTMIFVGKIVGTILRKRHRRLYKSASYADFMIPVGAIQHGPITFF